MMSEVRKRLIVCVIMEMEWGARHENLSYFCDHVSVYNSPPVAKGKGEFLKNIP